MMSEKQYAPFKQSIQADVVRYLGVYTLSGAVKLCLSDRTFRPVFTMRLCQALANASHPLRSPALFLARLLHRIVIHHAGMDFPWRARIDAGCCITHGWGLVVTPGVVIGKNVTLYHGVTLGQKDDITEECRTTTYPTIEDEVWIGAHAVIVGCVTIGRGSRIGAGTIVTKDVAPYSIVVGNPQRVIKTDVLPDVLNPAPIMPDQVEV